MKDETRHNDDLTRFCETVLRRWLTLDAIIEEWRDELKRSHESDLHFIAPLAALVYYHNIGLKLFDKPDLPDLIEAERRLDVALDNYDIDAVIEVGKYFSDCGSILRRLRDAAHTTATGRFLESDIEAGQRGDRKALLRLASGAKDWGEVAWYRKAVEKLSSADRARIKRYLNEDKVSRKKTNLFSVPEQEMLEYVVSFYRDEIKAMPHREIRDTLKERFPVLASDPKFTWTGSADDGYKNFRSLLRRKGLTHPGKGGRPPKKK